jgi:hypothetical protein
MMLLAWTNDPPVGVAVFNKGNILVVKNYILFTPKRGPGFLTGVPVRLLRFSMTDYSNERTSAIFI